MLHTFATSTALTQTSFVAITTSWSFCYGSAAPKSLALSNSWFPFSIKIFSKQSATYCPSTESSNFILISEFGDKSIFAATVIALKCFSLKIYIGPLVASIAALNESGDLFKVTGRKLLPSWLSQGSSPQSFPHDYIISKTQAAMLTSFYGCLTGAVAYVKLWKWTRKESNQRLFGATRYVPTDARKYTRKKGRSGICHFYKRRQYTIEYSHQWKWIMKKQTFLSVILVLPPASSCFPRRRRRTFSKGFAEMGHFGPFLCIYTNTYKFRIYSPRKQEHLNLFCFLCQLYRNYRLFVLNAKHSLKDLSRTSTLLQILGLQTVSGTDRIVVFYLFYETNKAVFQSS